MILFCLFQQHTPFRSVLRIVKVLPSDIINQVQCWDMDKCCWLKKMWKTMARQDCFSSETVHSNYIFSANAFVLALILINSKYSDKLNSVRLNFKRYLPMLSYWIQFVCRGIIPNTYVAGWRIEMEFLCRRI